MIEILPCRFRDEVDNDRVPLIIVDDEPDFQYCLELTDRTTLASLVVTAIDARSCSTIRQEGLCLRGLDLEIENGLRISNNR